MKKKCLLLPLLLLVTVFTTCTKSNKEEIKVKEAPHTNIQAADALSKDLRLLFNVVDQYILNNKSDEALFYANELITEAKKVGDKSAEAIGYYMKGYVYDVQKKEYVQALDCFFKAFTIQRELNQWQEMGKSYLGMGDTYYELQFFDRAKEYYELFIDNAQLINNKSNEAEGYRNMALVYRELNEDPNKVILFYKKALVLHEELNNPIGMASCYNGIANAYYTLSKDYPQAKEYYLQAASIFETNNKQQDLADVYYNLGLIHKALNEFAKAKDYFSKTIELSTSINYQELVICAHEWLGELAKISKNYPTAIQELTIAQQLAEQDKSGNITLLADITDTFSKLYEEMGDDSKAMDYVHKKEAWQNIAKAEREQITKLLEKQRFDTVKWEDTVEKGKEDKGISIWWYILSAVVISFVAGVKGKKIYTGIQNALSIIPKKKKTKNSLTETGTITSSEAEAIQDKLSQIERFKEANMSIPKRHLVDLWHLVKKTNWFQKSGDEK